MTDPPSLDYGRTGHRVPERPLQGLDAAVNWWIGRYHRRGSRLKEFLAQAEQADALTNRYSTSEDRQLQQQLLEFRDHFRREPRPDPEILLPALAAVREAAHRQIGLRAFPVQLAGALALHA